VRGAARPAGCRTLHHHVWRVASESLDPGDGGLPLDFGGIAHMVAECVHCGDVGKRWVEDLKLGRAQAKASREAHAERCRNRPVVEAGAGRWVGAGERMTGRSV
jgi:hypothetical protein